MPKAIDIEELLVWAFRGQSVEVATSPHEDALTVYWAVMALPEPHCTLVRRCAAIGTAPEWRPQTTGNVISLDDVKRARTTYREWVRSLTVLRQSLAGVLKEYTVYGPAAEEEPWRALQLSA